MVPARLLTEKEWRGLGVQQSPGWEHYERHEPEPHILLFRRALDHPYATPQITQQNQRPVKKATAH